MTEETLRPRRWHRTCDRTLTVLDLISATPDGLTAQEIAAQGDITMTSACDIVQTMLHRGYLQGEVGYRARYTLGPAAERMARAALATQPDPPP